MLAVKSTQPMGAMPKRPVAKGYQTTMMNTDSSENTHLEAFLAAAHRRKYPAKSTLIYAGDKSDSIYYIMKGSVTVLVEDESGREIIVAYLNKGDFFGEMPLFFDDSSRSAWVKAKTECEVAELSYAKFKELAEKHTELLYARRSPDGRTAAQDDAESQRPRVPRRDRTRCTHAARSDASARCDDASRRHADQDHASGDRSHRRLLARDGRSRVEDAGRSGSRVGQRQDDGRVRHALIPRSKRRKWISARSCGRHGRNDGRR